MKMSIEKMMYVVLAVAAALVTVVVLYHPAKNDIAEQIDLSSQSVDVVIAKTKAEHEKGLSGYKKLDKNQGMLFVFDREENHCIWNADVKFPIVAMYLNREKKLIDTASFAAHDDKVVCYESMYVLEVSPEWFAANFENQE